MNDFAFLHGGGQGSWVWEQTIEAMRCQGDDALGHLFTLDAPGCGSKRGRATEGLRMQDIARELVADIERAGLRQVTLVGHSQAGQAMPVMARLRPDLFRTLIYVTCSAPLPGQSVGQMIGDGVRGTSEDEVGWPVDPAKTPVNERFATMFCNDMEPAQAASFLARLGHDMWPLETYTEKQWRYDDLGGVPATFIVCMRDQALPPAWQIKFAERLRCERVHHIDAGHQVMNSRPHTLAEALRLEALSG